MYKLLVGIGIMALVGIGGFVMMSGDKGVEVPTNNETTKKEEVPVMEKKEEVSIKETVIKITQEGFMPNKVTIKVGEAVRFQNESGAASWPASAMHPTHTVYPGSDIKKCGTLDAQKIFDACRGIADGMSWSFMFSKKGVWKYHDHMMSGHFGSIAVE